MFKVERTDFGIKFILSGMMEKSEMDRWEKEVTDMMNVLPAGFGILVDQRELKPLSLECQANVKRMHALSIEKGFSRSVSVYNNQTLALQHKVMALQTGLYKSDRAIDASTVKDWEVVALKWLKEGVDPDKI